MRLAAKGSRGSLARLVVLPSVLMYGVSFFLPTAGGSSQPSPGFFVFLSALFYPLLYAILAFPAGLILTVIYFPCWLANVAYWVALSRLAAGEVRGAARSAVLAVALALTIVWMNFSGDDRLGVGYWCWGGSMARLAAGAVVDSPAASRLAKPGKWDRGWDD